ncbi:MAG: hypothetical protein K2J67_09055 [Lachnospiraceae bacterium]|nr:hypothetical protein [Lachnospiraceae bacterium]
MENVQNIAENAQFIKHFSIHARILLSRYLKYKDLEKVNNDDIDVGTYFDMIIVQLRALCIENPNLEKNYTAQIALRKIGKAEYADRLDKMLEQEFMPAIDCKTREIFTIRMALKTLADKFICHYDNFDGANIDGWGLGLVIEKRLMNPYNIPNLDTIMSEVVECLYKGLDIPMIENDEKRIDKCMI